MLLDTSHKTQPFTGGATVGHTANSLHDAPKISSLLSQKRVWADFQRTTILFSINHAMVTSPLMFATSLLNNDVGYYANAFLYIFTAVSSLLVAPFFSKNWSPRRTLRLGMLIYSLYVLSFAFAITTSVPILGDASILFGAMCGGMSAGFIWSSQGGYQTRVVNAMHLVSGDESKDKTTGKITSFFGTTYLMFEVTGKVLVTLLSHIGMPFHVTFLTFGAIAIACALLVRQESEYCKEKNVSGAKTKQLSVAQQSIKLWTNPNTFLLSFTNMTFGFSAAYMNGFVTGNLVSPNMGPTTIGVLGGLTCLCAGCFCAVFRQLHESWSYGKGGVLLIGSLCFSAIPLIIYLYDTLYPSDALLVSLFVLQGMGRGVYEGLNKGVILDFFSSDDCPAAFTNAMVQAAASHALCYYLATGNETYETFIRWLIIGYGILTFPAFLYAKAPTFEFPEDDPDLSPVEKRDSRRMTEKFFSLTEPASGFKNVSDSGIWEDINME